MIEALEVGRAKDLSAPPLITATDICFSYALCRVLSVSFQNLRRILLSCYILQESFCDFVRRSDSWPHSLIGNYRHHFNAFNSYSFFR